MISIVVPAYNEEQIISKTITDLIDIMDENHYQYEIIVVNDGSQDQTGEKIKELLQDKIQYIEKTKKQGYGAALKSGISIAKYDLIAITDADGTYPNEKIPELVKGITDKNYDMYVGARTKTNCKIPLIRKPAKWLLQKLAEYLTEVTIPDLNSGLRVFRKEIYEKFKQTRIFPNGFSFTTTITLAMLKNNYKVAYLPIDYGKRIGHSKIQPFQDTINFFNLIVRTVMYYDPLKVFIPLSVIMFILSVFVFFYSYLFMERILDTTTLILFVTGVQILAIGMLADLIDKRR